MNKIMKNKTLLKNHSLIFTLFVLFCFPNAFAESGKRPPSLPHFSRPLFMWEKNRLSLSPDSCWQDTLPPCQAKAALLKVRQVQGSLIPAEAFKNMGQGKNPASLLCSQLGGKNTVLKEKIGGTNKDHAFCLFDDTSTISAMDLLKAYLSH